MQWRIGTIAPGLFLNLNNTLIAMKVIPSICGLIISVVSAAHSATIQVDYSAAPGERSVKMLPLATAIPAGNKVAIGTFDTSGGFDVADNAGDLTALAQNWIEFDSGSTRTISQPGQFAETASADDLGFAGESIYLWIFKTDSNTDPQVDFSFSMALNDPAADFSDITAYGLFNDPGWIFPNGSNPAPGNFIAITSDDPGIVALHGQVSGPPVDANNPDGALLIPEPSTTSIFGLGLLLLVAQRRRISR